MGVSLSKGGNVNLEKEAGHPLENVTSGLGWDVNKKEPTPEMLAKDPKAGDFDLDASALLVDENDRILSDLHFVFYNEPVSPDGNVKYGGDNRTGSATGDDEQVFINLAKLDPKVDKVIIAVSIHNADIRQQTFGDVKNAYVRVVDDSSGNELARYDLSEDAAGLTAMVFGQFYRYGGEWKFKAIGAGYTSGLRGLATEYGVNAA